MAVLPQHALRLSKVKLEFEAESKRPPNQTASLVVDCTARKNSSPLEAVGEVYVRGGLVKTEAFGSLTLHVAESESGGSSPAATMRYAERCYSPSWDDLFGDSSERSGWEMLPITPSFGFRCTYGGP